MPQTLAIIIPAFNEEKAIAQTIKKTLAEKQRILFQKKISKIEIILVNDGSTDGTEKIAKSFEPKIRVISHSKNSGYGSALKTGFKNAKTDLIAFFDADATYPINALSRLCNRIISENAEMIIGSRLGKDTEMPKQRLLGNKLLAYFSSYLTDTKLVDIASGMRVFKSLLVSKMLSLPNDLDFTPAMTVLGANEKWKILFEPIKYSERIGSSKLSSTKHGAKFALSIINVAKLYNPLKLAGTIGIIFILIALFLCYPVLFSGFFGFGMRRIFLISAAFLIGVNFVFFGFLANFAVKLFYKSLNASVAYGWAYDRYLLTKYNVLGFALFIIGLIIILLTAAGFHWIFPLIGLALLLIGVQLVASAMIVKIIKELYDKASDL